MPLMRSVECIKPADRLMKNLRRVIMSFFKFKVKAKDYGYLVMRINGPFVHLKIQKKTLMKFDMREIRRLELDQADCLNLCVYLPK